VLLQLAALEEPPDLIRADNKKVTKDQLPFVTVAYGLSNIGLSIPEALTPDQVPPMPDRATTRSRLDRENQYFLIGPTAKVGEMGDLPPTFHTVPLNAPERSVNGYREFRNTLARLNCDLIHIPNLFSIPRGTSPAGVILIFVLMFMFVFI